MTINANHMEMCRFASRDDGYSAVKSEVERHLSRLQRRMRDIQECENVVLLHFVVFSNLLILCQGV